MEHVITFGLEHRVLGQINTIGVDEIQYAKGHNYLTLVYQIDLIVGDYRVMVRHGHFNIEGGPPECSFNL